MLRFGVFDLMLCFALLRRPSSVRPVRGDAMPAPSSAVRPSKVDVMLCFGGRGLVFPR